MARPPRPAWVVLACLGAASPWAMAQPLSRASLSCHTHAVVAGETLSGLAGQHLARPEDWHKLARINQIRDPRRLAVGKALCLPLNLLKPTPLPGMVLDVTGEVSRQPPGIGVKRPAHGVARGATGTGFISTTVAPAVAIEPVAKGDVIAPGTLLRTGAKGYVSVQLPDGSILQIQADTDARLQQSQSYETTGAFSSIWEVLRGRVESWVKPIKDGEPRHQIKTPQATLGVRGTTFRVATDGQRTLGETLSGSVAVRHGRAETLMPAGHGTVTRTGSAPTEATPLPAPPDIGALPALHERVVLKFELPPSPGARAWRIQVAEDAQFHSVRGEVTSPTPVLRMTDLPDGDYFLRARVANAQGLESADAVRPFRLKARPEPPIPLGPVHQAKIRQPSAPLSWTAHPRATHYRLQVARDAGFHELVLEQAVLPDTEASIKLPPGDYHWRLATTAAATTGPDHGPWGDAQVLRMREPPAQAPPPTITDTRLHFQLPSEPGQRFELQLARDAAFTQLIEEVHSDSSLVTAARPEEGGLIHVRYRAIDDDGFVGPYTTPQRVALPACVRSGSGACIQAGINAGVGGTSGGTPGTSGGSGGRFLTTQP